MATKQNQATSISDITLGKAITTYLSDLPPSERDANAAELHRMMRWFGPERNLSAISPIDLERYQDNLANTGIDPTSRLQPLKDFFAYAKQKKLASTNLGVHVRVRRKGGSRKVTGPARPQVEAPEIEVTREGFEQLQRELDRLENEVAPAVRADLQSAYADKDFRENAPYDAAKQRMGEIQGRINELRATLQAATIVRAPARSDRVTLGSTVTVRDLEEDEELTYTIVGPGEVDARRGRISISSPVGKALVDHTAGDVISVQTPAGAMKFEIVSISGG